MDTYIIRIRERQESDPQTLTGSVEGTGLRRKKSFGNLEQLWDILNLKKKLPKPQRKSEVLGKGGSQVGR